MPRRRTEKTRREPKDSQTNSPRTVGETQGVKAVSDSSGKPKDQADRYKRHRQRAAETQAAQSRHGRDIGTIPPIHNPARRGAAKDSFRIYCETYERQKFPLAWSADHLLAIHLIEEAVFSGGLFALAMPRGSGKTTLVEAAVRWCLLFGHRLYGVLVGADEAHAIGMLENIRVELETNELLLEDFPEVCYPIRCLEGIANRCRGQTYQGRRTYILWSDKEIVLPTIPGSPASGCCVKARGITGRLRGMKRTLPDGRSLRPDFVAIDDPQTDESAASPAQCKKLIRVLMGAILGLAGPGHKIAGVMPCTVIAPGDMADEILDREKYPQWQGQRTKMLRAFPARKDLWEEYARLRAEGLRSGQGLALATALYRKNRAAMDEGADVSWPARFNDDELSAVQNAMNLWLQDQRAFMAEYQNDPQPEEAGRSPLTPAIVAAKAAGLARGLVPKTCEHLVAYVDVHERLLYYVVSAWDSQFGGGPVDYGAYPKQRLPYFAQATAPVAMADVHRGLVEDAWILAGLTALCAELLGKRFAREDGAVLSIEKLLIDIKWGEKNKLLKRFCRRHPEAPARLFAAQGLGIGASGKPFEEYREEQGAQLGEHWRIPPAKAGDRWVTIDTNWWKTFCAKRLAMPKGTPGGWELFGTPKDHELFADHCVAEDAIEVTAKGRTIDEWRWKPGRPDNHLWDCLVGTAVAGSMVGVRVPGIEPKKKRGRVKLSEVQARKRQR